MIQSRVRWAAGGIGLALLAVAAWLLLERVPEGELGVRARGVAPAGWTVAPPWARPRLVPERGSLEVDDIELASPEDPSSAARFWLTATYTLRRDLAPSLRVRIADSGLPGAVTLEARDVLARLEDETGFEAVVSDRVVFERALESRLAAAGLDLAGLRIGVDLADVALVRTRTEEARTLAREPHQRILVIGLDGADWRLIRPLVEAGRLPTFARLMREGAWSRLRSYDPMFSPLLWTTMATGKSPDRHGVADFVVLDAATGEKRPITSDFRRVKALWDILTDFGLRSAWLSWWASFPAEPIDGIVVSNLLPTVVTTQGVDGAVAMADVAYPADYLRAHRSLLVGPADVPYEDVRRFFPLTREEFEEGRRKAPLERRDPESKEPHDPVTFCIKTLATTRSYQNLALDLLHRDIPFVSVYFEAIDLVGHRFQHYLPPRTELASEAEFERFREAVPAMYELQDELIGELLEASRPDTITLIVSDHGFRTGEDRPDFPPYTSGQPAEWHYPWGVLILHGPGIRATRLPPTSLYDVTPTLLYLAGLPLARDMPGRMIEEAFEPAALRRDPPRTIPTYEVVGRSLARRGSTQIEPEVMEAVVAQLQALGYVADDSPAAGRPEPGAVADEARTQVYYHRNLATNLIKQGELDAAERELLAANAIEPLPKTFALLSEIRARRSRFAEAAQAVEDGLNAVPNGMDPHSVLWMAEMWLKAGDAGQAEDALRRWDSQVSDAVRDAVRGRIADHAGETEEALADYERALREDPLLVHIALRLHELYSRAGDPERIRPFLEAGLRVEPKTDIYENLLGELARRRGDLEEALGHFRRAVEVQPENGTYLGNLAVTAAALGRRDEALEAIDWALRWQPIDPAAWLTIGSALDRLGQSERAVAAFRTAKELGAEGPVADIGIVLALSRQGRSTEARRAVEDALRRFPEDPVLRDIARRLGG